MSILSLLGDRELLKTCRSLLRSSHPPRTQSEMNLSKCHRGGRDLGRAQSNVKTPSTVSKIDLSRIIIVCHAAPIGQPFCEGGQFLTDSVGCSRSHVHNGVSHVHRIRVRLGLGLGLRLGFMWTLLLQIVDVSSCSQQ